MSARRQPSGASPINTVHEAAAVIQKLRPGSVEYDAQTVAVVLLFAEDFERFFDLLQSIGSGDMNVRYAADVLRELVMLGCPELPREDVRAFPLKTLYDFVRQIALVNLQLDLNDFFTAAKLLQLVATLAEAVQGTPPPATSLELSSLPAG